jgi:hypothetical protein
MLYYLHMIVTGVIIMYRHPWQKVFDNIIYRYNNVIHYVKVAINCEILKHLLPDCHVGDSVKTQPFAFTRFHTEGMTCLQRCFRPSLFEDTEKVSLSIIIFIVAPCILKFHWVLHTNKWTNCILYISLKLFTLKHFHCSYMFQ